MTFDPVSFALGVVATYAFSIALLASLVGVTYALVWWKERTERKEAVDQLMARVALRCIERPANERCN